MLSKLLEFLDGKKTYIAGAVLFIAGGLKAINVIDQATFEIIAAIAAGIAAFGLRMAIQKVLKK